MRLVPVGLAVALLAIYLIPAVPASSQGATCRISLKDPTRPDVSDGCTSVPWDSGSESPTLPEGEEGECHLSVVYCEPAFGAHLDPAVGDEADGRLNVSAEVWVGNYSYELVVVG